MLEMVAFEVVVMQDQEVSVDEGEEEDEAQVLRIITITSSHGKGERAAAGTDHMDAVPRDMDVGTKATACSGLRCDIDNCLISFLGVGRGSHGGSAVLYRYSAPLCIV